MAKAKNKGQNQGSQDLETGRSMDRDITKRVLEDGENMSEAATFKQEPALVGLRETLKHPVHRSIG